MIQPQLILCSGVTLPDNDPLRVGRKVLDLDACSTNPNVNIQFDDVAKVFRKHLSPRLVDLLEIASYVYSTDAAIQRGEGWLDDHTREPWTRDFQFVIPVRDLDFWCKPNVQQLLVQVLKFLSDDDYKFEFRALERDRPVHQYLDLQNDEDWPFYGVERVLMFSGGLDSLAGSVETAHNGSNLVLVSHRPVVTLDARLRRLFAQLQQTYTVKMIHVPVWIYKNRKLGREHTQRTRSFLFSALGTVVAESLKAQGVRFFENGIVSLNLPVADEVLRARASRTTHPHALELFTRLYSLVTERQFVVDNPYLLKTKAEVVSIIAERGASHLIQYTCSCAHTGFFQSRTQWHCGTCSQCIDRRIAILATGQAVNDLETDYVSDVFTGSRKDGYEKNMAVDYTRHAIELCHMSETEIATKFNLELSRAVRSQPNRREVAQKLVELHKRHGETTKKVLDKQLQQYVSQLIEGKLDKSSMLAMIAGQEHLASSWHRYADRIGNLLLSGIPTACKTHKPENEPHLQEICDGILKAHDSDLVREFPFMRWSSTLTKPDWSVESLKLWVELKYVRKREDVRKINEAISADITQYGDNQRRVLFVVYDPNHLITDEQAFSEPIHRREEMRVSFVR
ncbi:7-cyano-7-deazaguanine synthase [Cylindrospermum sp. NIES-4074]|nr:7-cyano-7-deazaguanine synthase [Cylindrospermum sp. NIES-4074]